MHIESDFLMYTLNAGQPEYNSRAVQFVAAIGHTPSYLFPLSWTAQSVATCGLACGSIHIHIPVLVEF
jgi:hypothetical protein